MAMSKIGTIFTEAGSASSSSVAASLLFGAPVPFPVIAPSEAAFSLPPASLVGLVSGLLSISVTAFPAPSLASDTSARFTKISPLKLAFTVSVMSMLVVAPLAKVAMVAVGTAPAAHVGLSVGTKVIPYGT